MKQLLLILAALLLSAGMAQAQVSTQGSLTASTADCAAVGSCVTLSMNPNNAGVAIQISGTFVGTAQFEGTVDSANWLGLDCQPIGGGAVASSFTATGIWQCVTAGLNGFRVRPSLYTSGSINAFLQSSLGFPGGDIVTVTGGTTALPVIIAICSGSTCYTTPVAGSAVAVGTTTTTLFAATFGLQTLYINNSNVAQVNVTLTDGNNAYLVGPTFGIPAFSNYALPPGLIGLILTNGLRASASIANAITVWFGGKIAP